MEWWRWLSRWQFPLHILCSTIFRVLCSLLFWRLALVPAKMKGKRRAEHAFRLGFVMRLQLWRRPRPGGWSGSARAVQACPGGHARSWRGAQRDRERHLLCLKSRWSRASPLGNGGNRSLCGFRTLCLLWKRRDYRLVATRVQPKSGLGFFAEKSGTILRDPVGQK